MEKGFCFWLIVMVGVLSVGSTTSATTIPTTALPDTDDNVTCEAVVDEKGKEVEYSVKCVTVKEDAGEALVVVTRTTNKGIARLDYSIKPKDVTFSSTIKTTNDFVFFEEGKKTATIKVPVKDNNGNAGKDEVHFVEISNPTTGKVKKGKAKIVVLEDDK